MPAGRPSEYTPEKGAQICKVIGEEGMPDLVAAGDLGLNVKTINYWADKHPEFSEALNKAKANRARLLTQRKDLSDARWIFLSKNWSGLRDKVDLEHTGPEGGPVQFILPPNPNSKPVDGGEPSSDGG